MITSKFIEISKQYGCEYDVTDIKVNGDWGSKLPVSIHELTLKHNRTVINVKYEFGNHNLAEIKFEISTNNQVPDFRLETKDHFSRLFSFKKNAWRIKCENVLVTSKLVEFLDLTGLAKIANDEVFEPIITGSDNNGRYLFNTKYYLGFNNKEDSIAPTIEFHKNFIDFINEKYCS